MFGYKLATTHVLPDISMHLPSYSTRKYFLSSISLRTKLICTTFDVEVYTWLFRFRPPQRVVVVVSCSSLMSAYTSHAVECISFPVILPPAVIVKGSAWCTFNSSPAHNYDVLIGSFYVRQSQHTRVLNTKLCIQHWCKSQTIRMILQYTLSPVAISAIFCPAAR